MPQTIEEKKEKKRLYYVKNQEYIKQRRRSYYLANQKEIIKKNNEYSKNRTLRRTKTES